MEKIGKVLLLDKDEKFLALANQRLTDQGLECQCAADITLAAQAMDRNSHDVVIAGVGEPECIELSWIKSVREQHPQLSIIIVTDHPWFQVVIESAQMRIFSRRADSFDWDGFIDAIMHAVQNRRFFSLLSVLDSRDGVTDSIGKKKSKIPGSEKQGASSPFDTQTYVDLTIANIIDSLSDLKHLHSATENAEASRPACHMFNCPRIETLLQGAGDAIKVIEETKSSFKSRRLKELRERLKKCVEG